MQAKYIFISLLLLFATLCSKAQSVTPQVLPANGGYYQAGSTGLSWSLGQPVATTFSAGSLMLTWGFQQNEFPLKPAAPAAQSFCADTAHTFTFSSVTSGDAGNQIEWATDSNFTHTHILTSPATFSILVASGADSVIWIRSRDSTTWMVSAAVTTHAKVDSLPHHIIPYALRDTVCPSTAAEVFLPLCQLGVRYYLMLADTIVDSINGNGDTLHLNTRIIDTTTTYFVKAVDTTTGCSTNLSPAITFRVGLYASKPVFVQGDTLLDVDSTSCYQVTSTNSVQIDYYIAQGGATIDKATGCVSNVKSSFIVMAVATSASVCNIASAFMTVIVRSTRRLASDGNLTAAMWTSMGPTCNATDPDCGDYTTSKIGAGRVYSFAFATTPGVPSGEPRMAYYAGTPHGGLWKSIDGVTWSDLSDGLGDPVFFCSVADMAIYQPDLTKPATLFIATGSPANSKTDGDLQGTLFSNGIYKSDDGGVTFGFTSGQQFNIPDPSFKISRLVVNSSYSPLSSTDPAVKGPQLFAATTNGIFESDDGGDNWYKVLSAAHPILTIEVSPSGKVFASGDDIYLGTPASGNTGYSFTAIPHPSFLTNPGDYISIDVKLKSKTVGSTPFDDLFAYMFLQNAATDWSTKVYNSTLDGTSTWTQITTGLEGATDCPGSSGNVTIYRERMALNPDPTISEFYVGNCVLNKVINTGSGWTHSQINAYSNGVIHADIRSIEYIPGTNDILVGSDGGVFRVYGANTTNGDVYSSSNPDQAEGTVQEFNTGLSLHATWSMASSRTNPKHLLIGSDDNGSDFLSETGWIEVENTEADGGHLQLIDYTNDHHYFSEERDDKPIREYINSSSYTSFSICNSSEGFLLQDPKYPNIIYHWNDKLYAYIHSTSWTQGVLFEGSAWSGLTMANNVDAFAVVPSSNGKEYCYLASGWSLCTSEEYLFVNRNFDALGYSATTTNTNFDASSGGCNGPSLNYNSDWQLVCLPTNDDAMCGGPISPFVTQTNPESWYHYQITSIAISDKDPNTIWLTYYFKNWDGSCYVSTPNYRIIKGVYDPVGDNWTWSLDEAGLPPALFAQSIVYEKGSNDGLYLSTDRGVWYKNAALSGWIQFQTGLPYMDVSAMEINYCSNQIRAATLGRGVYTSPLYSDDFNTKAREITTDETWNFDRDIASTITVDAGVTLTISNAIINMAQGTNIIVQPGGKLIVDGGTITNVCNSMWDGIIVKGQKLLSQDLPTGSNSSIMSANQGFVFLNGATIENAYEALRVYDYAGGTGWVSGDPCNPQGGTGGIVRAVGTTFKNVRRAAEFMYYKNKSTCSSQTELANQSYFDHCTFLTDNQHSDEHPFSSFVTMWGTTGIKFIACDFENNDDRVTDPHALGTGIGSIDASYTVDHTIAFTMGSFVEDRGKFKNFFTAVNVDNSSSGGSVNIYDADFTDNEAGVLLRNSNMSNVNGNIFTVGHLRNSITPADALVGAGFDFSTGFNHTLNKFNSANGTSYGFDVIGSGFINTSYTGLANNQCYANDYNGIKLAGLANEINRDPTGFTGLQFICNTNDNNPDTQFDFTVYRQYATTNDGIRDNQGDLSRPPANGFTTAASTNKNQFRNFAFNSVIYHWFTTGEKPSLNNVINVIIPLNQSGSDRTCPSNTTGTGGHGNLIADLTSTDITNMKTDFGTAYSFYVAAKNRWSSLMDEGHSGSLKSLVTGATSGNKDSVRIVLHSISPFISEPVLRVLADRTDIYNNDTIYTLMFENRNSMGTDQITSYLTKKSDPMTAAQADTLKAHIADSTARSVLEDSISHYAEQYSSLGRDIIMSIQGDTTGFDHNQYRYWLSKLHDAEADYMRIEDFMDAGIMDTALMELDSVPVRYSLSILQDSAYQTFRSLVAFKKSLVDDSLSISHLDTIHGMRLDSIARFGVGLAARKAKSILHFFYGAPYETLFEIPTDSGTTYMKTDGKDINGDKKTVPAANGYLVAYPNPTTGSENFDFKLPCDQEDGLLVIADMTGRTMYNGVINNGDTRKTIETKAWGNGVYLYRLTCANKNVGSGRFEVIK